MRDAIAYVLMTMAILLTTIAPAMAIAVEPTELDRGVAPQHPQQPQVAVDADGAIHVVYGIENFVRYRRSDDNGRTFSSAVDLPPVYAMSLGMRRGPRIAATDNAICVSMIGGEQGMGRDGDLLAMRSFDDGKTWIGPVQVNDAKSSAREGLHAMSAGPMGQLCCVWLDLRHGATEVMSSTSADGGQTWSENVLVYRSPDGSVCECCHPSVVLDRRGQIHVQFRNSLAGNRDMYVATSSDGGKTFGAASKLGTGSWPLDACPMDGGAISSSAEKRAFTWRRERDVYLVLDGEQNERRLGAGEQPWVASTDEGHYVVWLRKRGDAALLLRPNSVRPIPLADEAFDPVIAAAPTGKGPVVAVWESRDGKFSTIQCLVIGSE